MVNRILPLVFVLALSPAMAQDAPPPDDPGDGMGLIEEGAKLLFRGMMAEIEPTMDDLGAALAEMEPKLKELFAMIDDIANYEAPVMLENGDILIRRKVPLPAAPPTDL